MQFFDTKRALGAVTSLLVAVVALGLVSCDSLSGGSGNPIGDLNEDLSISRVQLHPDSAMGDLPQPDTLSPGDRLAIEGSNMNSVGNVYFLGYEGDFNPALSSENYMIATIPGDLPFGELSLAALDSLDAIRVTNNASEAAYNEVPVLPGPPAPESMSNEYAEPGEEVTITGSALYLVQSVTFPDGTSVPGEEIETTTDGLEATFTLPNSLTPEPGPLTYTTAGGTSESSPRFMYREQRGMLLNWDDHTSWAGWGATVATSSDSQFGSGAEGSFAILGGQGEIPVGDNSWYNGSQAINLNNQEWVAPENLSEQPGNFAVKFEMNIAEEWNTGNVIIHIHETTQNYQSGYGYRVQPWLRDDGTVQAVNWQGWRTFTIPLSEFTDGYGDPEGAAVPSLTALLGEDGKAGPGGPDGNPSSFRLNNIDGNAPIPASQAFAIDNIRVVRIAE
jgi:hypothetical protein